jgi:hypothetical protein
LAQAETSASHTHRRCHSVTVDDGIGVTFSAHPPTTSHVGPNIHTTA